MKFSFNSLFPLYLSAFEKRRWVRNVVKSTLHSMKWTRERKWLTIAEYVSLFTFFAGLVAVVISQQLIYAAALSFVCKQALHDGNS